MRARGYVLDSVILKRPTANDRKAAEAGSTDMRVFVLLSSPPPELKNTINF